jgi:hypothetical protein
MEPSAAQGGGCGEATIFRRHALRPIFEEEGTPPWPDPAGDRPSKSRQHPSCGDSATPCGEKSRIVALGHIRAHQYFACS